MLLSAQTYIKKAMASVTKAEIQIKNNKKGIKYVDASLGKSIDELTNKIYEFKIICMLQDSKNGLSNKEIAAKYNLSEGRISQIFKGSKK